MAIKLDIPDLLQIARLIGGGSDGTSANPVNPPMGGAASADPIFTQQDGSPLSPDMRRLLNMPGVDPTSSALMDSSSAPSAPAIPPASAPAPQASPAPAKVDPNTYFQNAMNEMNQASAKEKGAVTTPDPAAPSGFPRPGLALILAGIAAMGGAADYRGDAGVRFLHNTLGTYRDQQNQKYQESLANAQRARAGTGVDVANLRTQAGMNMDRYKSESASQDEATKLGAQMADSAADRASREAIAKMANERMISVDGLKLLMNLPIDARAPFAFANLGIQDPQLLNALGGRSPNDIKTDAAAANSNAQAGLATEKATDINMTRPQRMANLLASGQMLEARKVAEEAGTKLKNAQVGFLAEKEKWYPKEMQAKMDQGQQRADASLISANASAYRAHTGATNGGVDSKVVQKALMDNQKARDDNVSQMRALEQQRKTLQSRADDINKQLADKNILPDEAKRLNGRLSKVQDAIDDNGVQYSYRQALVGKIDERVKEMKSYKPATAGGDTDAQKSVDLAQAKAVIAAKPELAAQVRQRWANHYHEKPPF